MLVRLQCRYGKTAQFEEIMSHLVPVLESKGWRLHGAYMNSIGRLNRVYDLWEMPDANAVRGVLGLAALDPEFQKWGAGLADCLEAEELELMEEVQYSVDARQRRGG
ncbi:MAG: NIPSNAP family protein [Dehalococcoidia bacterium]|nr:NIPSNAP family protein [Dehalococcoidia bacterium]